MRPRILLLTMMSLTLTACERSRDILGFNRVENDAFAVNVTPELKLPEDFTHLPNPVAQVSEVYQNTNEDAKKAALSQFSSSVADEISSQNRASEDELLTKAKAQNKDPEIRQKLYKEAKLTKEKTGESLVKNLLGVEDKEKIQAIDPFEEKKRLDQAHDAAQ